MELVPPTLLLQAPRAAPRPPPAAEPPPETPPAPGGTQAGPQGTRNAPGNSGSAAGDFTQVPGGRVGPELESVEFPAGWGRGVGGGGGLPGQYPGLSASRVPKGRGPGGTRGSLSTDA